MFDDLVALTMLRYKDNSNFNLRMHFGFPGISPISAYTMINIINYNSIELKTKYKCDDLVRVRSGRCESVESQGWQTGKEK